MTNNYPYQDLFEQFLKKRELSTATLKNYSATLTDLFNYLSNFNVAYQNDHHVNQIFDRDIEQYLGMLVIKRSISNTTYNRVLSEINVYFKFLFNNNLNEHFPTLNLKGRSLDSKSSFSTKWLYSLDNILGDDNVHPYTRMVLLLTNKGFQSSEFLLPGFYQEIPKLSLNRSETLFLNKFEDFIKPLQERNHSKDIFLKQRISEDPHITSAGLHKYLKPDESYLGINLSPKYLYQSYIINYLSNHKKDSNKALAKNLKLDPASLSYYQNLFKIKNTN